ncbi:hypothetical protein HZB90_01440 [archaeon]|nr:hypothetical protein [archaeon]
MKKAGEKEKSIVVHVVFIALVILGVSFILQTAVNLTGYAVLDATTAKAKLETALSSSALFSQLQQASICVVINDPAQPLSLEAIKSGTGWTVTETTGYCAGLTSEDVVVQFSTYDSFSRIVDDPSPMNIANGAISQDYQILQSRYVELGGNVICDAAFKVKYCGALKTMSTPDQLIDGDLTCCIDKLTSSQKKLLEQHLQEGNFRDEIGILEQPGASAVFMGMSLTMLLSIGGAAFILIIIIVAVLAKGKKAPSGMGAAPAMPTTPTTSTMPAMRAAQPQREDPQITDLRNYVAGALGQGYAPDEVRTHLLEIGWDSNTADRIIGEAQQMAQ